MNELAPDSFFYGGHYIIEFDPDSLWYETSLTIAALALKQGMKTEYHVFQHFPSEAMEAFSRLGVDAEKLRNEGLLSIWDSYTETLQYETEKKEKHGTDLNLWVSTRDKPLDMKESAANWAKRARAGYTEQDKRWLHIDDNTAIFLQYNDEEDFVDAWRTGALPYGIRARETPHFLAFVKGVASEAFYTKFEALCDGIIDVKAQEEGGRIENYIRVRMLRGKTFDSRWHRLLLGSNGEVRLLDIAPQAAQRRLAAIMFTDMVGYTALGQRDESLSLAVVEAQQKLLRPVLATHDGREVKTMGDAFLVEFTNALEAARCAYDVQRSVREFNLAMPSEKRIHLRVGIHLGDVVENQGDIFGDAVNVASRIEPLAEDGGVCLTQQVYDQVHNKLDVPLVSKGKMSLKNMSEPVEVYRMVMPWDREKAIPPTQLDRNRIAILPFANMSPDLSDEYFADGMTEELISTVSKIEGIDVISRTSVMQYKKTPKPIKDLSQELAVGIVLEGSVRKSGNKLRVAVQMIDATKDRHLWAKSYDRDFQDIFAIQGDIASRVAEAMKARVSETGSRAILSQTTSNLEAYTLYLRAMQLFHEGTEPALKEAISIFERAISKDPDFVRAYAGLAYAWRRMVSRGYEDFAPGIGKAETAALRAIELGPGMAEAHAAMSDIHSFMDRFKESISEAERAIKIDPNLSEAYLSLGTCYASLGILDRALTNFQSAYDLDPLSFRAKTLLAEAYRIGRREGEALDALEKLRELNPQNPLTYSEMADCYIQKRDFTKAQEMLNSGTRFGPEEPLLKIGQGFLYALSGRTREAESELDIILRDKRESVRLRGQQVIQMGLGNLDEAFAALMRAAETHSWWTWTKSDPLYERLQKDARFAQFCLRVGIPA